MKMDTRFPIQVDRGGHVDMSTAPKQRAKRVSTIFSSSSQVGEFVMTNTEGFSPPAQVDMSTMSTLSAYPDWATIATAEPLVAALDSHT